MKRLLILALGLFAIRGFALDGGNSSGGEELYGAGSLPYETQWAETVGIADSVTGNDPWDIRFRKLYKGTDTELTAGTNRAVLATPKPGALLFVQKGGSLSRAISLTAERATAVEEFFADTADDARVEWSVTYGKSQDKWLSWSAELVAGELAQGPNKSKVLAALLADPSALPAKRNSLLANFLPNADVEKALKDAAIDTKASFQSRREAANAFFHRAPKYRALIEAWKEGREGADSFLKRIAQECWQTFFSPRPRATDAEIQKLKAELSDPSTRQRTIFKVKQFHADNRTAWLLADVARDKSATSIDRGFAMSELKEMKAISQVLYIALDSSVEKEIRSRAILEIGLSGEQDLIQTLVKELNEAELRKEAEAFLQP